MKNTKESNMGYMKIPNLYKDQDVLLFKEVFYMEKIHGTSAHIKWKNSKLSFFSGGVNRENFITLFDHDKLIEKFHDMGREEIVIYGEAYGGKCQKMAHTYGDKLRFVVFEVKIDGIWLDVESAFLLTTSFDLDFVDYGKCSTNIEELDKQMKAPSVQAVKCGITEPKEREGIVIRPLKEILKSDGNRIIAKHKNDSFRETKTKRNIDAKQLEIIQEANAIADEWVTEMRLVHVLDKFPNASVKQTGDIIKAMIKDIEIEAEGEIVASKASRQAISRKTASMFKKMLKKTIGE
jgi:hypothetical protein